MSRVIRYLVSTAVGAVAGVLLWPGVASADNCGSLIDCYRTAQAGLAALVGLSVLAGVLLSVGLDFLPGVGTVKGIIEAVTGRDLITGQELEWWERLLGVIPVIGGVAGVAAAAAKVSKAADAADAAADAARAADRAADAADAAHDADRAADAADAAHDADRAADAADAAHEPAKLDESMGQHARPAEQATAQRLADNPDFNGRTFTAPPPPDPGYDWVDDLGRTYDAMGDGTKAEFVNMDQFKASIDSHLLKSNDFTVIDMTGFSPDQVRTVAEYVDSLSPAQQAQIVRVGF
jgi:hypothetical protein